MSDDNDPFRTPSISRRELLLGGGALIATAPFVRIALASGAMFRLETPLVAVAATPRLTLTSTVTQSLAPFACAQAFGPGEIPAGLSVACDLPNFQAVIKNRWPDGSAKIALLSGRVDLTAGVARAIDLRAGTAATGVLLTESDLLATGITATLTFAPSGSVNLASLIGVASTYDAPQRRWTAGRVMQWIAGTESASWIYYAPVGADAHLAAWFEVRLWRGGAVEVLPWIENGYIGTAAPTVKSGTAGFSLGGTSRYNGALALSHHTRAVLASGTTLSHWLAADPAVRVRHDTAHLQSTRLVPAYHGVTATSSPLLQRVTTNYTPLARSDFPDGMGTAGYHPSIGPLPEWDVAYLTSAADPRAASAVIVNAYCAGRYGLHYRDETTNRPLRFSQYPNLVLNGTNSGVSSSGASSTNSYTPTPGGTSPPTWATSHHPSIGYLAYLLTGRFYFMEESQFSATLGFLKQTDVQRQFGAGILRTDVGANTTRGAAWSLRTLAQACCITPDDDTPLRTELLASVEANVRYQHAKYVGQPNHPHGVCAPYSDYTSGDGVYQHASWMEDFLTASFGWLAELQLPLAGNARTLLDDYFAWKCRSIVGRLGPQGAAGSYNYRDAAQYNLAVAPSDTANWDSGSGPWYSNWEQSYVATTGGPNAPSPDTALRGGNFPESTSYWGNLQPAIAYAVTRNVAGAQAAYQRLLDASNWSQIAVGWNDDPVWGVKPHTPRDTDAIFRNGFET